MYRRALCVQRRLNQPSNAKGATGAQLSYNCTAPATGAPGYFNKYPRNSTRLGLSALNSGREFEIVLANAISPVLMLGPRN